MLDLIKNGEQFSHTGMTRSSLVTALFCGAMLMIARTNEIDQRSDGVGCTQLIVGCRRRLRPK